MDEEHHLVCQAFKCLSRVFLHESVLGVTVFGLQRFHKFERGEDFTSLNAVIVSVQLNRE
jgi:hypothetical protein